MHVKSSSVATLAFLVNMTRRLRSISHHVLPSDFREECSLFRSDWALKERPFCLFVCVFDTDREGDCFEGPSPDLEPISMQML